MALVKLLLCALLLSASCSAAAATVMVAVAANFTAPAKELAAAFEAQSNHRLLLSFASTGKLYAQIYHGAPYQVLLAADSMRPQQLIDAGLALASSRFTYARGKIVLFSIDEQRVDPHGRVLFDPQAAGKLAIANPKTAPYGAAAIETLQALGLYRQLRPKFVQGENIAQTYQFVYSGNASMGFVALSQVVAAPDGSQWRVPEHLYTPIRQDAVLLTRAAPEQGAVAFLQFLRSDRARSIIEGHGYGLE